jgi:hypothetical protein
MTHLQYSTHDCCLLCPILLTPTTSFLLNQAPADKMSFVIAGVTEPSSVLQPVAGSQNGPGNPNGVWCCADFYIVLMRLAMHVSMGLDFSRFGLVLLHTPLADPTAATATPECRVDPTLSASQAGCLRSASVLSLSCCCWAWPGAG